MPEEPDVVGEKLDEKDPIKFFNMMFPEGLHAKIALETNRYADQVLETKELGPKSRFRQWSNTDADEVKAFLGLRIAMGLCAKPTMEDYWSESWLTQTPNFGRVMSRNRYKLLSSFLHFADNTARLERNDAEYDALFKVRPVLQEVLPAWEDSYVMGKNVAIDESMIGYRGRIFFRQYIQSKHHRFGIKAFVLACSKTSYTYQWDVYTRSLYSYDKQVGQGHSIVRKLSQCLPAGHVIYLDSFYTTPALCTELYNRGIGVCGTVGQNRKGMPDALKDRSITLKEGDRPVFRYKSPVLACLFLDRKNVRLLSTVHNQEVFQKELPVSERQKDKYPTGKRTVYKPMMVQDYNKYMGGVDRTDQMSSYHPFPHKCPKWYMRVFHHIIELALINARICYNITHSKKLSSESFRQQVCEALVTPHMSKSKSAKRKLDDSVPEIAGVPPRLLGRHFMGKFDTKKPDCIVCSNRKLKKRRQTCHFCKTCPNNPALCDIPCFEVYHTLHKYK